MPDARRTVLVACAFAWLPAGTRGDASTCYLVTRSGPVVGNGVLVSHCFEDEPLQVPCAAWASVPFEGVTVNAGCPPPGQ